MPRPRPIQPRRKRRPAVPGLLPAPSTNPDQEGPGGESPARRPDSPPEPASANTRAGTARQKKSSRNTAPPATSLAAAPAIRGPAKEPIPYGPKKHRSNIAKAIRSPTNSTQKLETNRMGVPGGEALPGAGTGARPRSNITREPRSKSRKGFTNKIEPIAWARGELNPHVLSDTRT